jgi:hypothetical protein
VSVVKKLFCSSVRCDLGVLLKSGEGFIHEVISVSPGKQGGGVIDALVL